MLIKISGSIVISKDIKAVFNFISNLENDKLWRREVNNTTVTGPPQINAEATESSYLSKRLPSHINQLFCSEYIVDKLIVYQTVSNDKFYLKTNRQVENISQRETRFIYQIEFDKAIVKHALGFNLPSILVRLAARGDMNKYLKKLKTIIEQGNTADQLQPHR
jgi:hypothetical protein